jgi:ankyrin repeat protein
MAVFHKWQGVVKWLIEEKKANVNCCEDGDISPLCTAAYSEDAEMVEYLLSKGADE